MHARKRPYARLTLVALAFLLACGEPTAPATPAAVVAAPVVRPDANLVDITNGILNVTNGITTLIGDLLPCNVTTDQWNTASIGPEGGRLNVGPHTLVIPRGALRSRTQITAHAVRGNQRARGVFAERAAVRAAGIAHAELRRLQGAGQAGAGGVPEVR